jgi:predicted Co/Zn/Cd cation transporter (cation efflux family)
VIHVLFLLILVILIISGYLGHAIVLGTSFVALFVSLWFRRQVKGWKNSLITICFKLASDWFVSLSLASFIILIYWFAINERPYSWLSHFKDERTLLVSGIIMSIIITIKLSYYLYNKFHHKIHNTPLNHSSKMHTPTDKQNQYNNSRTLGNDLSGE